MSKRKEVIKEYLDNVKNGQILEKLSKIGKFDSYLPQIEAWNEDFPQIADHIGGCRALVKLQNAYHMNLTELSENGRVHYTNSESCNK